MNILRVNRCTTLVRADKLPLLHGPYVSRRQIFGHEKTRYMPLLGVKQNQEQASVQTWF